MSESTIPFEGQTLTQASPPEPGPTDSGNRTKLLALGGLAAVLVLALVAYFLVFAGGSDEEPSGVVRKPASSGAVPEAEAPAAAQPAKKQRISAKSFGRDPFKALIVEPVVEVGTQPVAAPPVAAPSTGSVAQTDTITTQPETSSPAQSTAHRFKVVDVAPDNSRISVKVDGEFYRNLKAGEVFATFFKVRFIGGAVNDFQFGEESFKVVGTKAVSIG